MFSKNQIDALFGFKDKDLVHMTNEVADCVFYDKHGDLQVFHSTPETKLRVLKLGDETQLHLEHARKMKLD